MSFAARALGKEQKQIRAMCNDVSGFGAILNGLEERINERAKFESN